MVQKITIFEPHLDGAQFGPTIGEHDTEARQDVDYEMKDAPEMGQEVAGDHATSDADSSPSRLRRLLVAVGVFTLVFALGRLAARRFRSGREAEQVEIDQFEAEEEVAESAAQ